MNNPLVTVIIPTFNCEEYICEAIDSVLAQRYSEIEILVIDDGSIDNTKEVINSYIEKKQIKYIFQENKGLAGARNTGLRQARGKYLQFLDSDDIIDDNKIAKQVKFLEENEEIFAVYSDTNYFRNTKDKIIENYRKFEEISGDILNKMIAGNFIPVNAVLLRKIDNRFDEDLTVLEDWDFWLRLCLEGKMFSYMKEKLNWVRLHNSNMSSDKQKMLEGEIIVLNKLQDPLSENAEFYFSLFRRYRKLKKYDKALAKLKTASKINKSYRLKYWKKMLQFKLIKTL